MEGHTEEEYAELLQAFSGSGFNGYESDETDDAPNVRLSTPSRSSRQPVVVADADAWANSYARGGRALFAFSLAEDASTHGIRVKTPARARRVLPESPTRWDEAELVDSAEEEEEEEEEYASQQRAYDSDSGAEEYAAALFGAVPFPRALRAGGRGDAAPTEADAELFVEASQDRYRQQMNEIASLEASIASLLDDDQLEASISSAEARHADQLGEIATLERELQDAQATFDRQMEEIASLESQQAAQVSRIEVLSQRARDDAIIERYEEERYLEQFSEEPEGDDDNDDDQLFEELAEELLASDLAESSGSADALVQAKMRQLERVDVEIDEALDGCEQASTANDGDALEVFNSRLRVLLAARGQLEEFVVHSGALYDEDTDLDDSDDEEGAYDEPSESEDIDQDEITSQFDDERLARLQAQRWNGEVAGGVYWGN